MTIGPSLRRRLLWLLSIKLLALVVMRQAFFGGEHRVRVDAQGVETRLFVTQPGPGE